MIIIGCMITLVVGVVSKMCFMFMFYNFHASCTCSLD
jgi:hypothetical protein